MKKITVLLVVVFAFFGCATDKNNCYRSHEDKYASFYERHFGDSMAVDALDGFLPTIILGLAGDAIEKRSSGEKQEN